MSWVAVMTNGGAELLKGMLGGAQLSITRAAIGSELLSVEEIKELEDLNSQIPAYVQAVKLTGKTECETVQVRISNLGLTESAVMHQVGLYAKTADNAEILFAVYQNDFGDEIPSYSEHPDLLIKFNAGLDISITDNIVVVTNHGAFITNDDLETHNTNTAAHPSLLYQINGINERVRTLEITVDIEGIANPFAVTFGNLDGITANAVWNDAEARLEF